MLQPATPYTILGIESNATFAEIRTAYLRKALVAHPDKGGSTVEFQTVVAAFNSVCERSSMHQAQRGEKRKRPPSQSPDQSPPCEENRPEQSGQASRSDLFFDRLYSLLCKLSPESRRDVIATQMNEEQRKALERRIHVRRNASAGTESADPGKAPTQADTLLVCESEDDDGDCEEDAAAASPHASSQKAQHENDEEVVYGPLLSLQDEKLLEAGKGDCEHVADDPSTQSTCGITKGICKRKGSYYALVFVNRLIIESPVHPDLEHAINDHVALVAVKQYVLARRGKGNFEDAVRSAVAAVASEHSCNPSTWHAWVQFPATYWIGSCLYTCRQDLDEAVATWRRLADCTHHHWGEQGNNGRKGFLGKPGMTPQLADKMWKALRSEYVQSVTKGPKGGNAFAELLEKRLQKLEEQRQPTKIQMIERWKKHKELSSPHNVEARIRERITKILQGQASQLRQKECQERWRLLRNPKLTMADILGPRGFSGTVR